jgi:DMSO reductase family type II enzyme heme b subunit
MARRYAPARALGADMAGPRDRPVQDLVAEGPGTLAPVAGAHGNGRGRWADGGWTIVLSRPLPSGLPANGRTQVAFAVWEGAREEAGARKMRTGWVPLLAEGGR